MDEAFDDNGYTDQYAVYVVVIPDHPDALDDLLVSGPVVSYQDVLGGEGLDLPDAEKVMEQAANRRDW